MEALDPLQLGPRQVYSVDTCMYQDGLLNMLPWTATWLWRKDQNFLPIGHFYLSLNTTIPGYHDNFRIKGYTPSGAFATRRGNTLGIKITGLKSSLRFAPLILPKYLPEMRLGISGKSLIWHYVLLCRPTLDTKDPGWCFETSLRSKLGDHSYRKLQLSLKILSSITNTFITSRAKIIGYRIVDDTQRLVREGFSQEKSESQEWFRISHAWQNQRQKWRFYKDHYSL